MGNTRQNISSPSLVKYASFSAIVNEGKGINISWNTESELNNSHFEMERSFDLVHFQTIGVVLDGFEGKETGKIYQFKDNNNNLKGKQVVYYRLKQIDLNGQYANSKVLTVKFGSAPEMKIAVAPNPVVNKINVSFNTAEGGVAEIRIVDAVGQIIITRQSMINKGNNNIQIEGLGQIAPGVYIAQLIRNGVVTINKKFIKN